MIEIPEQGDAQHRLWSDLIDLAEAFPNQWTVIGAHMVALYAWDAGVVIRPSRDVDVLADVRLNARASEQIADFLVARGYEPEISRNGIAHLFRRNEVEEIDLFVPDGIGPRTRATTARPHRTIRIPGGTQALERTEMVDVSSRDVVGALPRPNLIGAVVVKLRAIAVDDVPDAQRADVALLLTLIDDPDALVDQLTKKDRQIIRKHEYFADPARAEWAQFHADDPEAAALVYRRLLS